MVEADLEPTSGKNSSPYQRKSFGNVPLDMSFNKMATLKDLVSLCEPRPVTNKLPKRSTNHIAGKEADEQPYFTHILKLNNNVMTEVDDLFGMLTTMVVNPKVALTWIDLSFNQLTKVNQCLTELENLQILYLHGNQIKTLNEVDKLASMAQLCKLSLHGNGIESDKLYRAYVISRIPQLKHFDMAGVTKADRLTASHVRKPNAGKKKRSQMD